MRTWEEEARSLREQLADLEAKVEQLMNDAADVGISAVFRITATIGTDPLIFFPAEMLNISGEETEGTPVLSTSVTTQPVLAGFGNAVPPALTYVVASWVDNRWAFIYNA